MKVNVQKILTDIKSVSEIFNALIEEHNHGSATTQGGVLCSTYGANFKTRATKCEKSAQTENKLKDTLNELGSVKLITGILSEEIKILKQMPVIDNSWTTVESRNSHQKIIFQPSKTGHSTWNNW
jgi:phosphoribosylformylglycinamidine (FGAM) synthase-like amidotransferase family enzyme